MNNLKLDKAEIERLRDLISQSLNLSISTVQVIKLRQSLLNAEKRLVWTAGFSTSAGGNVQAKSRQ